MARLGKDVVDLLDVSVTYSGSGSREVLRDVEWRIAPGERTGILGANGAGKSTLLGLIAGTVPPTTGRVKRGKTVQLAVLDQASRDLDPIAGDMVREVLARLQTMYQIDGKDVTPHNCWSGWVSAASTSRRAWANCPAASDGGSS